MRTTVQLHFIAMLILMTCALSLQAQPRVVTEVPANSTHFVNMGNLVYFTSDETMWRTDGTESGTIRLQDGINQSRSWSFPAYARASGGIFYFLNADSRELWRSDGTPAGTQRLKTSSENIKILESSGSFLYFSAADPDTGYELYRTDGTTGGTTIIKDLHPGSQDGFAGFSAMVGDALFFAGNDGINGRELWKTDGSSAGTVMVKDINPGPGDGFGDRANVFSHAHLFYFMGNSSETGMEPWVSDGTAAGTTLLQDVMPGPDGPGVLQFTIAHHESVYFLTFNASGEFDTGPADLWKTQGAPGSTTKLVTIGTEGDTHSFHSWRIYNDKVYFSDYWEYFSDDLWVTDGTSEGTYTFYNLITMEGSLSFFDVVDDHILFTGSAQGIPTGFYRTDGTEEGTREFARFKATSYLVFPRDITKAGDFAFYADHDGMVDAYSGMPHSEEDYYHLYQTDGITTQSIRTRYGVNTVGTDNITDFGGRVLFTTQNDQWSSTDKQKRLWIYDPTTPPPVTAHFTLVHAGSDQDLRRLTDGALISNPYNAPVNIRYNPVETPGSVVFRVNGVAARMETAAPYALAGDTGGDYWPWEEARPGTYRLTATPYSEPGGKGTAGESLTITFTIKCEYGSDDCLYTGTMLREYWQGVQGNSVSDIPVDTRPYRTYQVPVFEGPTNSGTNYGARFRGYIIPPADGAYTFWIASNDHSELWLSTDDNAVNKVSIAYVNGATGPRQWDKFASQKSSPVMLKAGKKYYIEALHKQGVGTDNVAVGWQLPDGTMERPVPGNRVAPFTPGYSTTPVVKILSPQEGTPFMAPADVLIEVEATDGDDGKITKVQFFGGRTEAEMVKLGEDFTPPFSFLWEDLASGAYVISAHATDEDSNTVGSTQTRFTVEEETGACAASGTIVREYWTDIQGNRVSDIPFHRDPDGTQTLTLFEGPTNVGTNYGARIRGYICPPVTGGYQFWIASNDHSELWLSNDDDPGSKVRIAHITGATVPREWDKYASQRSATIWLETGKRYYIEALHKQGVGTDNVAVGWTLPGGTMERPIPGSRLSPFGEGEQTTADAAMSSEAAAMYSRIDVYPNPVERGTPELTISGYDGVDETIDTRVEIISMTGEVVFSETIACGGDCHSYLLRINEQLVPGVYLVNMNAKGVRLSRRLLVR